AIPVPQADCTDATWSTTPTPAQPSFAGAVVGDALDQLASLVRTVSAQALQPVHRLERVGTLGTCARVDLTTSPRLLVQLQPPAAAPTDPRPVLTYTSSTVNFAEFGNRWDHAYRRRVSSTATDATVTTGQGASH